MMPFTPVKPSFLALAPEADLACVSATRNVDLAREWTYAGILDDVELLCGQEIVNSNRASNMLKSRFYVCPVCGNAVFARGEALISCCGIRLPALEAEEADPAHRLEIQKPEDELFVSADHPMSKDHYLSFIAYMTTDCCEMKVLYPEGNAEARFFFRGSGWLYYYCNQHGLFRQKAGR